VKAFENRCLAQIEIWSLEDGDELRCMGFCVKGYVGYQGSCCWKRGRRGGVDATAFRVVDDDGCITQGSSFFATAGLNDVIPLELKGRGTRDRLFSAQGTKSDAVRAEIKEMWVVGRCAINRQLLRSFSNPDSTFANDSG
jgi:hypothetical protein